MTPFAKCFRPPFWVSAASQKRSGPNASAKRRQPGIVLPRAADDLAARAALALLAAAGNGRQVLAAGTEQEARNPLARAADNLAVLDDRGRAAVGGHERQVLAVRAELQAGDALMRAADDPAVL